MKILVINCGSSSLKYQLFDMDTETMIAKGNCERIGVDGKIGGSTADGRKFEYEVPFENHTKAFLEVKKVLTEGDAKVIDSLEEISAIGHRVVQGGALFKESTLVTEKVIEGIETVDSIAAVEVEYDSYGREKSVPTEDVIIEYVKVLTEITTDTTAADTTEAVIGEIK